MLKNYLKSRAKKSAPALQEEYPEIVAAVQCWQWCKALIIYREMRFYEERSFLRIPKCSTFLRFP